MGADLNIYVGPYLDAKGSKKITEVETLRGCLNSKCKKHHKPSTAKFCPDCGEAIGEYDKEKVIERDAQDLLYEVAEFEDTLSYTDPMLGEGTCFTPNERTPFDKGRDDLEDGGEADLSKANIDAEINWFYSHYNKQILYLEKELGAKNVKVKWGVIAYWN